MALDYDRLLQDKEVAIIDKERLIKQKELADSRAEEWKLRSEELTEEIKKAEERLDDIAFEIRCRYRYLGE